MRGQHASWFQTMVRVFSNVTIVLNVFSQLIKSNVYRFLPGICVFLKPRLAGNITQTFNLQIWKKWWGLHFFFKLQLFLKAIVDFGSIQLYQVEGYSVELYLVWKVIDGQLYKTLYRKPVFILDSCCLVSILESWKLTTTTTISDIHVDLFELNSTPYGNTFMDSLKM